MQQPSVRGTSVTALLADVDQAPRESHAVRGLLGGSYQKRPEWWGWLATEPVAAVTLGLTLGDQSILADCGWPIDGSGMVAHLRNFGYTEEPRRMGPWVRAELRDLSIVGPAHWTARWERTRLRSEQRKVRELLGARR